MNARGIPTAAYQVLHLLPEVGYPPPAGVTPPPRPRLIGEDTQGGVPPPARSDRGTPSRGTPQQEYQQGYPLLGYSPGLMGRTPLTGVPPSWTWLGYLPPPNLDLAGIPPPPHRCGLTNKVKLLPPVSYYVRGR